MTKELIGKLRELSDRESLSQLIALGLDDTKNLEDWPQDYQDEMHQAADVILAAGFSRAAVPDAATGNVQKMYDRACADIQEYSETIKRLEAEVDDWREGWIIARLTKAEAERDAANEYAFFARQTLAEVEEERDAALDAVERVRAVLAEERAWLEHLVESGDAVSRTVIGIGKVEAALDGAPEPEWEYGSGPEDALDQSGLHTSRVTAERGVVEWNEFTQRSERMGGRPLERLVLVRRRKAGPWEACNE